MEVRTALTIAGSDSGGGAGIQADLKTLVDHQVFGMSAVTAITAQNSQGVARVDPVPVDGLRAQLHAVFDDFRVDAIKIGMLGSPDHVACVADVLEELSERPPVVLDPVMVASTGHRLLEPAAERIPRRTAAAPGHRGHPKPGRGQGAGRRVGASGGRIVGRGTTGGGADHGRRSKLRRDPGPAVPARPPAAPVDAPAARGAPVSRYWVHAVERDRGAAGSRPATGGRGGGGHRLRAGADRRGVGVRQRGRRESIAAPRVGRVATKVATPRLKSGVQWRSSTVA